jgi:hypothetical protein
MFHVFTFPWPASISTLFDIASMSTASIDVAAPECTINPTYVEKWSASQALPVFLMSVLLLGVAWRWRSVRVGLSQWSGVAKYAMLWRAT